MELHLELGDVEQALRKLHKHVNNSDTGMVLW